MTIGIIGAMSEELEILLKEMNLESKECKAKMEFNYGTLWGHKVVAVVCGIGKVNAAVCAQILITEYKVDKVINVGIAGGIGKDIYPGDIVIADSLVQHDMDTTAFGDKIGQIPRLDTFDFKCDKELVNLAYTAAKENTVHKSFVGRIVSGDQFIANVEKIRWLNEEFNALACEMEGGSIAHVSYLNSIPFVVIRSISDNANNGAEMDYEKFKLVAVENSTNILKRMLLSLIK
ncbi:5'-methylthioadenosine/adenosylhomocysteine nucleosidase [Clostridium sp. MSJ-4]|uniref:5'-methylthioadenosine/adenosylhomocysteine nucleosidase n=1 Tax=Clostridium simiarum TaxID=2841506 RepID=A0ABS6F5B8_9CLOT|nr:5'-methylthioadenosine/adenosylhomocysteine nucleosidase [Clostridium simiarum]MBU5593463.1 5'-methylthioadenosine/adenosylhomocysteine nucleosidase [Clostridium simiarum]